MKKNTIVKLLLPIGLLVVNSTFIIERFTPMNDFTQGLVKGIGIGIMLGAFLYIRSRQITCASGKRS